VERLRLRLPSIAGVRPIAPPVPFGDDAILVEATRPQDVARRFPLERGRKVKVGVRSIHALAHPGLSFLILTDGSEPAKAAVSFGGQIARVAHARVTILSYGMNANDHQHNLQQIREQLGSGLAHLEMRAVSESPEAAVARETEHQDYDLVIVGLAGLPALSRLVLAENILKSGHHHLLLAPPAHAEPISALVCVRGGEPGKEDVLFAGRFLRHLGVRVALLSVVASSENKSAPLNQVERFLGEGVRSLGRLGVPARTMILSGNVRKEIDEQMKTGEYDLLVLGAPLHPRGGEVSLDGLVGQIVREPAAHPILIVRSHYAMKNPYPTTSDGRINIVEKLFS
jgi:sulfate transport system ATP-binding protein